MALRKPAVDALERDRIRYPADDGIPMEHTIHDENHALLMQTLKPYLKALGQPAFVAGNNFVYFGKGPTENVGPDFYVVLGAADDPDRDCWRSWHENGLLPQVIVEMLSKRTVRKDKVKNFDLYERVLKVRNYFMCNHRKRHLEGYVLDGDRYVPLLPDRHGRLYCEALGLWLGFHGRMLRWFTAEGVMLPTGEENAEVESARADAEQRRAEAERRQADDERRRADTEHERADAEHERADAERRRADTEQERADAAQARASEAEQRLRQLQDELNRRSGGPPVG
jgi:Uma2 family endonuclease